MMISLLSPVLVLPLIGLVAKEADSFVFSPPTPFSTEIHSTTTSTLSDRRPTPSRISQTENFREAKELSQKFLADYEHLKQNNNVEKKRVNKIALLPDPFEGNPVIQLEFATRVPWVIDEPESPL